MSAKTGLKTGFPGAGTRECRIGRRGVPLAALIAVLAAAGATWYGFLAHSHGHPTARLAGALALTADGLAAVLLATPPLQRPAVPVPGGPGPSSATTQAEGAHTGGVLLGLLSMGAALIHCAVIDPGGRVAYTANWAGAANVEAFLGRFLAGRVLPTTGAARR